jgi:hypothetical protein
MTQREVASWSAAIAPSPVVDKRFPPARLLDIVDTKCVALRGWNFPHIPRRDPNGVVRLPDGGIEARVDSMRYQEIWRFHPSGLYTHRWRMREEGTAYQGTIHFVAAIYSVVEVFEFGRRLYSDDQTVDSVLFKIALHDVLGRHGSGDSFEDLPYHLEAQRNEWAYSITVPRTDLLAGIHEQSSVAAISLFSQLGFSDISDGFVRRKAQSFLEGKT